MKVFRWAMIFPISVASWCLIFIFGMITYSEIINLCPEEKMVSGMCEAGWWSIAETTLISIFSAIAAMFVLAVSSFIAPSERLAVILLTLFIGGMAAVFLGIQSNEWVAMVSAVVSGIITAIYFFKKYKNRV